MKDGEALHALVIYDHPKDFPQHWVMRRWRVSNEGTRPHFYGCLYDTLEQAREDVPRWLVCLHRDPNDDPSIVETWI